MSIEAPNKNFYVNTTDDLHISFETADNGVTRAIIEIPLMHVGVNAKYLEWTADVLEKIAPMFRGIPFRYDINGQEGSSHTPKKLYSPHFDVGWTYNGERGAWYDRETGELWVKGEVTHPDVVQKLQRKTSEGKRELNFASMGVIVKKAICNITGKEDPTDEYIRGNVYNGKICTSVPKEIKKALHVALTNDPADGEAEIKKCIFQELDTERQSDMKDEHGNPISSDAVPVDPKKEMSPGGLAPAPPLPANQRMGSTLSSEELLKYLAERVKTLELQNQNLMQGSQQLNQNPVGDMTAPTDPAPELPTPEVVNNSPMQDKVQDNMGGTSQYQEEQQMAEGQYENKKVPVNPTAVEKKPEMADASSQSETGGMAEIKKMLQEILSCVKSSAETADAKDLQNATISQAHDAEGGEDMATRNELEKKSNHTHESNDVNKKFMNAPNKQATEKTESPDEHAAMADNSEISKLRAELADMKQMLQGRAEFADSNVPEFGGANAAAQKEFADLSAEQRREEFGDYGSWAACFGGASEGLKFKR